MIDEVSPRGRRLRELPVVRRAVLGAAGAANRDEGGAAAPPGEGTVAGRGED